jgi:DNA-binding transcriptional LysR family regulator
MEPDRWLGVEFRHLAALEAVGACGSFGAAATRLGYTQSAVSQQIATLERLVGERLVDRPGGPRRVSLTEAGEVLIGHASAITARLAAAKADLTALSEGAAGLLRVGVYQSVGVRLLPTIMRRFTKDWPNIEIRLSEASDDDELLVLVERGELDLTFTVLPVPDDPFETLELYRDPYVLLVPAGSPLAERETPPGPLEIASSPLIGALTCRSGTLAEEFLRERGCEPRVVFRSGDNGTVQGLVGAGVGLALVPHLTVDPDDPGIVVRELDVTPPPRLIALAWHRERHRSPSARAFAETAAIVCSELGSRDVAA